MATTAQIQKLRRKIQDFYNPQTNAQLTSDQQAFQDDELADIIDDAVAEVTDGAQLAENIDPKFEAWAMMLARADAMLQIAIDEARRIKWETGNEVQDPSQVAPNLISIAKALQSRYKDARDRELKEAIAGIASRPAGGKMVFNSSVKSNSTRNFNNPTVRRNSSPDH